MGTNVITINIRNLPAAIRRDDQVMRDAILRGARIGCERGRAIMVRRTPVDQGQLKASWRVHAGAVKVADSGETTVAELKCDAPHAGIVELGSRPHKVSPEAWAALYEWVRRHPELYASEGAKPRMRSRNAPHAIGPLAMWTGPDPQITAVTNAIAWKIRRDGTKATYFIRDGVAYVSRALVAEIGEAIARLASERVPDGDR